MSLVQHLFHVTLCVTFNLREWHSLLNNSVKLYETDFTHFMLLLSSAYDSPKEQVPSLENNIHSETFVLAFCCGFLLWHSLQKFK
jgi:hypothetical protein